MSKSHNSRFRFLYSDSNLGDRMLSRPPFHHSKARCIQGTMATWYWRLTAALVLQDSQIFSVFQGNRVRPRRSTTHCRSLPDADIIACDVKIWGSLAIGNNDQGKTCKRGIQLENVLGQDISKMFTFHSTSHSVRSWFSTSESWPLQRLLENRYLYYDSLQ